MPQTPTPPNAPAAVDAGPNPLEATGGAWNHNRTGMIEPKNLLCLFEKLSEERMVAVNHRHHVALRWLHSAHVDRQVSLRRRRLFLRPAEPALQAACPTGKLVLFLRRAVSWCEPLKTSGSAGREHPPTELNQSPADMQTFDCSRKHVMRRLFSAHVEVEVIAVAGNKRGETLNYKGEISGTTGRV
ncbi:hypothetical protein HPP92_014035 [Vanilla planifolia]|uniref:Uncharacterized protein n=1 Tax=Vanilla planifolia TaxID=51239 RepID=A0A835QKM3_VANPL|nr:hypothetical protein HPP92_014035 [Vanilla planifolia]